MLPPRVNGVSGRSRALRAWCTSSAQAAEVDNPENSVDRTKPQLHCVAADNQDMNIQQSECRL